MYYVYILYSEKLAKYYYGQTSNLEERVKRHNAGLENFTSKGLPWKLVWFTTKETRAEALILEKKLKNLSQIRVKSFIEKYKQEVGGPDDASVSEC